MADENVIKFLITTWGKPWRNFDGKDFHGFFWGEVTYIFEREEHKSRDSLPILAKKIKPTKILILALDSVISLSLVKPSDITSLVNIFSSEICDSMKNIMDVLRQSAKFPYYDFLEKVRSAYNKFIREELDLKDLLEAERLKVEILPNVGRFAEGEFRGNPRDIYALSLYYIARHLMEEIVSSTNEGKIMDNVELYIDTSHGINYLPILVYEALMDVAKLTSYTFKTKIYEINSEPYVGGVTNELRVHRIADLNVFPDILWFPDRVDKLRIMRPSAEFDFKSVIPKNKIGAISRCLDILKDFIKLDNEKLKGSPRKLIAFLGAFKYGLPLVAFTLKPAAEQLLSLLDLAVLIYRAFSVIASEGEKYTLTHYLNFDSFFDALVRAYILSSLMEIFELRGGSEVEIEKIKVLKARFFEKNRVLDAIISRELGLELEKFVEERASIDDFIMLDTSKEESTKAQESENGSEQCKIDIRTFFAHAGLMRKTIKVNPKRRLVKYREDCIDTIVDVIFKAVR